MMELWALTPPVTILAMAPLLAIAATAWTKAAVVLGILRGGLGGPAILPAPVIWGLAAVLAGAVMVPVMQQVSSAVGETPDGRAAAATAFIERGWPVLDRFLADQTAPHYAAEVTAAFAVSGASDPSPMPAPLRLLAFMLTELAAAFRMGVLLLVPFVVIDLIAAQALMALGMPRLSPMVVAVPAKLLLFVIADGWTLLMRGFAASSGA